jgi:hypothetical protein
VTNTLKITLFLALLAGSFFLGYHISTKREIVVNSVSEITIADTAIIRTPINISMEKFILTMRIPNPDTIRVNDTLYVEIPRTQKEYADSSYTAWVSGYKPRLDSIEVYNRTIERTITRTLQNNSGRGIMGGMSITPQGLQPSITVGYYFRIK